MIRRKTMKQILKRLMLSTLLILATGCGSSVAVWTGGEVAFARPTPDVIDRMREVARVHHSEVG